jgi:DinB superfamily
MVEHAVENGWWIEEWGNPCRECGFDWSQPPESVIAAVEELPTKFEALLAGRTGDETAAHAQPGEPIWSAKAYVFHVADNLRIFAERLEGVFAGAPTTLAAYDQDELAAARDYDAMSLQSALWSVRAATEAWASAARESLARPFTYQHAERGELNAAEITRGPGHDALHHYWDVTRAVQ